MVVELVLNAKKLVCIKEHTIKAANKTFVAKKGDELVKVGTEIELLDFYLTYAWGRHNVYIKTNLGEYSIKDLNRFYCDRNENRRLKLNKLNGIVERPVEYERNTWLRRNIL